MKLYGFTKTLDFPCVCWGRRGVFFKLKYVKGSRIKWYYGKVTSEDVLRNFFNNNGHRFFGLVVKEKDENITIRRYE